MKKIEAENAEWIGLDGMCQQLVEECGELIKATCKYNRARGIGQYTPVSRAEARGMLIAEMADVIICIEQLLYLMDVDYGEVEILIQKAVRKVANRRKFDNWKGKGND